MLHRLQNVYINICFTYWHLFQSEGPFVSGERAVNFQIQEIDRQEKERQEQAEKEHAKQGIKLQKDEANLDKLSMDVSRYRFRPSLITIMHLNRDIYQAFVLTCW